jgi:hypothetical protein
MPLIITREDVEFVPQSDIFTMGVFKKSCVARRILVDRHDPNALKLGGVANFEGYYRTHPNEIFGYGNWT